MILTCAAIRLWVKIKLLQPRKWAWSDVSFTVALLATLVTFSDLIISVTGTSQMGIHQWDVPLSKIFSYRSLTSIAISSLMAPLSAGLIKITIFFTYIELFSTMKWVRITCYIGMGIIFTFHTISVILTSLWSFPLSIYMNADNSIRSQRLSTPAGIVGLITDIYLFIVPLVAVSMLLEMTFRKRVGIVMIFGTGFLAIVSSILSIVWRIKLDSNGDHTWNVLPLDVVIVTEQVFGIIVACTPHIAKFFRVYNVFLRTGSKIKSYMCCCCVSRKKDKSNESENNSSGYNSVEPTKRRSTKLYPGLDLTTVGGTRGGFVGGSIGGTNIDKINEETESGTGNQNSEHKHSVSQHPAEIHWAEGEKT
ncbi:hypothetical protein DID88_007742 [Monilinia fructigena]|uniref:Rhodopsin domain-containing protein n=1 Tax=Monilinia fructigena TaxID=38457 RepID=A0A395J3B3_9HELO|nr:hypothetical protein DID88_007742 [Monilinia fructigena]